MPPKSKTVKKPKRKLSAWNVFLKKFVKANPNMDFATASHKASIAYKK